MAQQQASTRAASPSANRDGALVADRRHLRLCGLKWHVIVAVPHALRSICGASQLKRSLHTDSLTLAQKLRWPVLEGFKQIIEIARRSGNRQSTVPLSAEACLMSAAAKWAPEVQRDDRLLASGELDPEAVVPHREMLEMHVEEIVKPKHGLRLAQKFFGIASGIATPLGLHHEDWLGELTSNDDTKDDHRLALRELTAWGANQQFQTLQEISHKVAGSFATYLRKEGNRKAKGQPQNRKTTRKRCQSLAAYWDWLVDRGHLPEDTRNPWRRILTSLGSKKGDADAGKRNFTDDELKRLLYTGAPGTALKDYMFIAALSGMRIDEIARLKVGDCKHGVFHIGKAKTKAGKRDVPIHSALVPIIRRLAKGRAASEWLIPDEVLGGGHAKTRSGKRGDRSMPISKRFGRFRQSVGVHDCPDGQRQSSVTFHSFRRWFSQQAKDAGISEHVTAAVVGHGYGRMTYGLYAKDELTKRLRECVEAAKLPARPRKR